MSAATTLIRGGRVIDPASGRDERADVLLQGEHIERIGLLEGATAERVVDASGCIVMPGLVDLCARLGEPGGEHKGLLESELGAAATGGVTSLVCPPDTDPVLDEPGLVDMLKFRARRLSRCRLFPLGALTAGLHGKALTEMAELRESGCVGFSQADVAVADTHLLLRAFQYAATFGFGVWLRPQDAFLGTGMAASGAVATRLGLSGVPVVAETIALHTLIELARATGVRLHLARLSSAAGVALVRAAKAEGLQVTADVSINSLHLTDVDIGFFNPAMRLEPPLRQQADRAALRAGLADGTLDALVSDHTPISRGAKYVPFGDAEPGATGLELLLPLALKWAEQDGLPLPHALRAVTCGPAHVLGEALGHLAPTVGRLVEGGVADVCVFDPAATWALTPGALKSQGTASPFAFDITGMALPGRVRATWVAGVLGYIADA